MSRIRFYVDEDAAEHAVTDGLHSRGIDVLTVQEAGREAKTDEEQLEFAAGEGRVLYTLNVGDSCRLHHDFLSSGRGPCRDRCQSSSAILYRGEDSATR